MRMLLHSLILIYLFIFYLFSSLLLTVHSATLVPSIATLTDAVAAFVAVDAVGWVVVQRGRVVEGRDFVWNNVQLVVTTRHKRKWHAQMSTLVNVCMVCTCIHMYLHICMYACMGVYLSTCVYVCLYGMYICIYCINYILVVINTYNMSQSLILHQEVTTYQSPWGEYFLAYKRKLTLLILTSYMLMRKSNISSRIHFFGFALFGSS